MGESNDGGGIAVEEVGERIKIERELIGGRIVEGFGVSERGRGV